MKTFIWVILFLFFRLCIAQAAEALLPLSDPENRGGWVLNRDLSDEFEGEALDTGKWFVQGTDGKFHKWHGRAPSQFAPHNVRVEDGKLKLRSQWEPDYGFSAHLFDGRAYENITTAGVVSHHRFLYGYMEVKTRAGDAPMTSSFWTLGYQSELDIYEQMGRPLIPENSTFDHTYMFSIHDWRPGAVAGENRIFNHKHQLDFRVADDFHVYGCEWGVDSLKFFADGKLVYETTKQELGDAWVLTNPLEIWFDSETFPWMGIPEKDDLPVDYEIEYLRVWQKPDANRLEPAFFSFEGPMLEERRLPEKGNAGKSWMLDIGGETGFSISDRWAATGRKSLRFSSEHVEADSATAFSPYGCLELPAGEWMFSMQVWVGPESNAETLRVILEEPWLELPDIELEPLQKGRWVRVERRFRRQEASGEKDRIRIRVVPGTEGSGADVFYMDDLRIEAFGAE